jgi:hypothetical protein
MPDATPVEKEKRYVRRKLLVRRRWDAGRAGGRQGEENGGRREGNREGSKKKIHHGGTKGTEEHREGREVTLRLRAFSVSSVPPW